jgi:large subunit ribosomal protein L25
MEDNRARLAAKPRTVFGKKVRFLRREGWVPANVYGNGLESKAIQVQTRETEHLLTHVPRNALLAIEVDGSPKTVLIKGVMRKPTTGEIYHVDFYEVSMTHTLRVTVPLVLSGEAPAVRQYNSTILQALDYVDVECLPGDLPTSITVDIEGLAEIDDAIFVRDLPVPAEVSVVTPEDELVVKALAPTIERELVEEAEEAAAEAAEAAAEEAPTAEAEAEAPAEAAAGEEEKEEK